MTNKVLIRNNDISDMIILVVDPQDNKEKSYVLRKNSTVEVSEDYANLLLSNNFNIIKERTIIIAPESDKDEEIARLKKQVEELSQIQQDNTTAVEQNAVELKQTKSSKKKNDYDSQ